MGLLCAGEDSERIGDLSPAIFKSRLFPGRRLRLVARFPKACPALGRACGIDAVRVQHVVQSDHAFEYVDIRPIDYRQNVNMGFAHSFQREMQRMIGVHVRKVQTLEEAQQLLLGSSFSESVLNGSFAQNTDDASIVFYQPRTELARLHPLQSIMNAQLCRKGLRSTAHY